MGKTKQSNQNIGLILGFASLIIIFVVFGIFVLFKMQKITDLGRTIYDHPLVVSNAANQANTSIAKMHHNMKDVVLFNAPKRVQAAIEAVDNEEQEVYRQLNTIRDNILGEEGKALEKEARQLFADWRAIRYEVINSTKNNHNNLATEITNGEGADHVILLEEKMLGLTGYARNKATTFVEKTQKLQTKIQSTTISFLLVGILTSLFVAILTLRRNYSANMNLLDSEARYRSLIENQTELVCRFTPDGPYSFANEVYCDFFGLSQAELIGSDWKPPPVDDDYASVHAQLSSLTPQNPSVEAETRMRSGNGEIHWMHICNTGVFDSQGHLLEVQSIARDITDRKKAEDELRSISEREKELADIVRNAPVAIAYGYPDGRLENCNAAFSALTGYSLAELKEINWNDVLTPQKWLASEWEKLSQLSPKQKSVRYEKEYIHKDGRIVPIDLTVTAKFDSTGNIINFIGFAIDISEPKQLEIQLRHKYKMEAVGVMAGGMAHNFNNNLAIILGNLNLSLGRVSPQSEIGEFLDYAKVATLRSRDLVKQIMTYGRTDAQTRAPLNLLSILNETLSLLKATIPSSISLHQIVSPEAYETYILADASQIQECLINLSNNAVHAMDEQGELTFSLRRVQLKQENIPQQNNCSPGDYLCLSIKDQGIGIPAEILENIFDPFFTTKELFEGTGMGLSTVQGIVKLHQGMVTVESNVGEGTVFSLYFPELDHQPTEATEEQEVELQRGSERVLFVDDDEMVANLSQRMLEEMGYQVTMFTDSVEALKIFSANPDSYDLIMTDQTMPGLTGKELILEIKKLRPEVPTVLCTGYSNRVNEEETRKAGVSAFLMKPFEFSELSLAIRSALQNG